MQEIIHLHINPVLLKDLKQLAEAHELEVERLCDEIIESYMAGVRLKKVPPMGKTWRKPRNQEVH